MKATLSGRVIADSSDIVQNGGYSYFPATATQVDWLQKSEKTTSDKACPHGVQFYDVMLDGQRFPRVAWVYEAPQPSMQAVGGRYSFWKDVQVA